MAAKFLKPLLKRVRFGSKKRKNAGFTLLELLIATLMAVLLITALLNFVVDLMQTERQEYARNETQREMQMALDFIVNDLREAAYIYNNEELNNQARGVEGSPIRPLREFLPTFPQGAEPILAFWKPDPFPYRQDQRIPDCGPIPAAPNPMTECHLLEVRRRTYTLVVYAQTMNPINDLKWKGVSRIMRYQLRMYGDQGPGQVNLSNKTQGYVSPLEGNVTFGTWPGYLDENDNFRNRQSVPPESNAGNTPVLVDFLDYTTSRRGDSITPPENPRCPTDRDPNGNDIYQRIPPEGTGGFDNPSFMVCVSSANKSVGNQDVLVFLRGNPTGKAGVKVAPLLAVKTQAVARGVVDKKPQ
jgi:type II secretory pathway pseudopilin PulG